MLQYWEYVVTSHCTSTQIHLWRYISTATLSFLQFGKLVVWAVGGGLDCFGIPENDRETGKLFLGPRKKSQTTTNRPPKPSNLPRVDHGIIHHLTLRSCSQKSHSTFYLTARHLAQWEPWEPSKPWFWWTFSGGGTRCPRKWSTSQGTGWAADEGFLYLANGPMANLYEIDFWGVYF